MKPKSNINVVDSTYKHRLELVESLIQSNKYYENKELYDYFSKIPGLTKELVKKWYKKWYEKEINNHIKVAEEVLGNKYISLLIDPAILNRFDQFINFAKDSKGKYRTPFELRSLFSDHLGTITLYRGMVLKESEMLNMKESGILAPEFISGVNIKDRLTEFFNSKTTNMPAKAPNSPLNEFFSRVSETGFKLRNSMVMSLTKYKEIAESVGYHDSPNTGKPGYKLYVFELNIPELSIVRFENYFETQSRVRGEDAQLSIGKDFKVSATYDMGVEVLSSFIVGPENIVNIKEYDKAPDKYE